MVDEAARARTPGGTGFGLIAFGCGIADMLEDAPALDEALALGNERLKLARADFGAVLLALRALLPVFIVVELALNAGGFSVE